MSDEAKHQDHEWLGVMTFRGAAHPWLCDVMGHLNTRNYAAMFDDAGMQLLGFIGHDFASRDQNDFGWADVSLHIDLKAEVHPGTLIAVRSRVLKIGRSSLSTRHTMIGVSDERIRAVAETIVVYFDLTARTSSEIPPHVRAEAEHLMEPPVESNESIMNFAGG